MTVLAYVPGSSEICGSLHAVPCAPNHSDEGELHKS